MNQSIPVRRLNHVALKVRDLDGSVDFYKRVMGFTEDVGRFGDDVLAFLRAPGSANHHDLALLKIGPKATDASARSVGLFHCAWEVDELCDLVTARDRLVEEGCYHGENDHGATKAVYGTDPTATRSRSPGSSRAMNGAPGKQTRRSRRRWTSRRSSLAEAEPSSRRLLALSVASASVFRVDDQPLAVVGSIILPISVTLDAGNPLRSACSSMSSALSAT